MTLTVLTVLSLSPSRWTPPDSLRRSPLAPSWLLAALCWLLRSKRLLLVRTHPYTHAEQISLRHGRIVPARTKIFRLHHLSVTAAAHCESN